ncbi:hypothetical protein [Corallococcus sp. CA054B]|uniref:hypothetical protein n=1 Tax=Corallococcus sp. CA054B TaxID=2316734 RepID=UPI0013159A70|nr:hypothetical protein [Corallococcus sp. CA054B]
MTLGPRKPVLAPDLGASTGGSASYLQYLRNTVDAARQVFPDADQEPVPRSVET